MAVQLISNIWDKVKTNYSYTSSYRKQVRETDEDIQNMQEGISGFRKIIRTLRNYSPNTITKDKLEKNLESFVKEYNELKKDSKNIENKDIKKELLKMDELISENKKELKKIGMVISCPFSTSASVKVDVIVGTIVPPPPPPLAFKYSISSSF